MVAVIGDVHGCFNTLVDLYKKIKGKYPDIDIYCVGDLVDRGNFNFEVVSFFLNQGIKCTPGNHDYMFYDYFRNPGSVFARTWGYNGNEATLISYSEHNSEMNFHLDYLRTFPLYYDLPDCFISHAGISRSYFKRLDVSILNNKQLMDEFAESTINDDYGILWNREILLNINKLQVIGHTRQPEVRIDSNSNGVYIDTGAYSGNKLSCIIVERSNIIDVLSEYTHSNDIT